MAGRLLPLTMNLHPVFRQSTMSGGSAVAGALARTLPRADDRKRIRGMREFEVTFPTLLMQLHQLECDYDDGNGIDFEPTRNFSRPRTPATGSRPGPAITS